jgi:Protein of unknown function (DUF2892)
MLTKNIGTVDRIIRIVIGVALLAWAIAGMPFHAYSWIGYVGVVPLLTAFTSFCPIYRLFGANTCRTT